MCYNADAPELLRRTLRGLKPGGSAVAVFKIRSKEVRSVIKTFLDGLRQDGFEVRSIALTPGEKSTIVYDAAGSALPEHGFAGVQGWTFRRAS